MAVRFGMLLASATLAGCAETTKGPFEAGRNEAPAKILPDTMTSAAVRNLPAPERQLTVAVYELPDLTGQHKPNPNFAEYSRAVTQGADALLVDVLTDAGQGSWFNVVERRGLSNILRERQIIQATRQQFEGDAAQPVNPLTFAGVLIEGGVVAYESNIRTGGVGARYLGVGANTEYQEDYVTVALRLVSVTSGNVILSVTTTKQIYSTLVQGNVFRYVSSDSLLDLDVGYTRNSPPQFALREAIELSVFALVMEGHEKKLWNFREDAKATEAIATYMDRRTPHDEEVSKSTIQNDRLELEPVSMNLVDTAFLEPDVHELLNLQRVERAQPIKLPPNFEWVAELHARNMNSRLSFGSTAQNIDITARQSTLGNQTPTTLSLPSNRPSPQNASVQKQIIRART